MRAKGAAEQEFYEAAAPHGPGPMTVSHDPQGPDLNAALHEAEDEVRRQRHALERAEADQIGLLKELNHRVKNNMQMLLSLLSSAARESETGEARRALNDASRRVAVIGAAQQVLYGGEDVGTDYAAAKLIRAVAIIACGNRPEPVDMDFNGSDIVLSNDTAVPLALILNELICNAVRHGAAADGGAAAVRIDLRRTGDGIVLTVEDDGPGFAEDASTSKRASGLGLVRGLARQLGGTLTVERPKGARCLVTFHDRSLH